MPTPTRSIYPKLAFFISLLGLQEPLNNSASTGLIRRQGQDSKTVPRTPDNRPSAKKILYAVRAKTIMECAPTVTGVPAAIVESISDSAWVAISMFHSRRNFWSGARN